MNENEKFAMKRVELSLKKFNEVAIPHHLGLLQNHKSNIEKSLALGNWTKIKKEEINAMRIVKQIKNLLLEMDVLRDKVRDEDLAKFDELIAIGKEKALSGIQNYMELELKSPVSVTSDGNTTPINQDHHLIDESLPQIQAEYQSEEHQLLARQACLEEFENLQREVADLHGMFNNVSVLVQEQHQSVDIIADNAEEALENVQKGESQLRKALSYKKAMYPVVGAFLGTCVGGPIGLLVGLKAGGLAAVGCGILGFTGGSVLKSNETLLQEGLKEEKKDD